MDCSQAREVLSALRDGEVPGASHAAAHRHLAGCAACRRVEAVLDGVGRRLRVAGATPVPDLTGPIVTAGEPVLRAAHRDHQRRERATRLLVALLGLTQVLLALPLVLGLVAPAEHALRHLGALELGIGLGLVLAAWQPRRAAGILPVVGVVAVVSVVLAAVDIAAGTTSPARESVHLVEVLAVGGVWWLVRLLRPVVPDGRTP